MIKFVEVKEIPGSKVKKNVHAYLREFVNMNVKVVKVDFDELDYANAKSAYSSFYKASRYGGYPVTAAMRNGELYLINRDI